MANSRAFRSHYVWIAVLALAAPALLIGISLIRGPVPSAKLQTLRDDPMATWVPTKTSGPEERYETNDSKGLIVPTSARILRQLPLESNAHAAAALSEAVDAAKRSGWSIESPKPDTFAGSRYVQHDVSTLQITLRVSIVPADPPSPAYLYVGLQHH